MSKQIKPPESARVPCNLVEKLEEYKTTLHQVQKAIKTLEKKIVSRMGDSEIGEFGDPDRVLRYFTIYRKAYKVPETTYHRLVICKREELPT